MDEYGICKSLNGGASRITLDRGNGLKVYVPSNSYVEILTFNVLGGGTFGRWLDHEGGAHVKVIYDLIKETPESFLTPLAM